MHNSPVSISAEMSGLLVPTDQLRQNQQVAEYFPDLRTFLLGKCAWVDADDAGEDLRRFRKWLKVLRFYENRQLGRVDPYTLEWKDVKTGKGDDPLYQNNCFTPFIDSIVQYLIQSRPRLRVTADSGDPKLVAAARYAQALLESYATKLYTATFRQREIKRLLLMGHAFRYTYYDATGDGITERLPVYEEREITPAHDAFICKEEHCGSSGPAEDVLVSDSGAGARACPDCGSENTEIKTVKSFKAPVVVGHRDVPVGEIRTESVSGFEMKVPSGCLDVKSSYYLKRSRRVLRDILLAHFPWALINRGVAGKGEGLAIQASLQASPGASGRTTRTAGEGSMNHGEHAVFEQYWLRYETYCRWHYSQDTELGPEEFGLKIPAKTTLGRIFPDGMYIAKCGDEILELRNEKIVDHWTACPYRLMPERFWGDGAGDFMVPLQEQVNESESLRFLGLMADAGGMIIYDKEKIDHKKMSAKPGAAVPMKGQIMNTEKIENFIFRLPGSTFKPESFNHVQELKNAMQFGTGGMSFNVGVPNIDVKTAHGMEIVRQNTLASLAPCIELRDENVHRERLSVVGNVSGLHARGALGRLRRAVLDDGRRLVQRGRHSRRVHDHGRGKFFRPDNEHGRKE
jgi:hypothetical protein